MQFLKGGTHCRSQSNFSPYPKRLTQVCFQVDRKDFGVYCHTEGMCDDGHM